MKKTNLSARKSNSKSFHKDSRLGTSTPVPSFDGVAYSHMLETLSHNDGTVDLLSILWGEMPKTTEEIKALVVSWLDDNCDNAHFSRWTSFGNSIYTEMESLIAALK